MPGSVNSKRSDNNATSFYSANSKGKSNTASFFSATSKSQKNTASVSGSSKSDASRRSVLSRVSSIFSKLKKARSPTTVLTRASSASSVPEIPKNTRVYKHGMEAFLKNKDNTHPFVFKLGNKPHRLPPMPNTSLVTLRRNQNNIVAHRGPKILPRITVGPIATKRARLAITRVFESAITDWNFGRKQMQELMMRPGVDSKDRSTLQHYVDNLGQLIEWAEAERDEWQRSDAYRGVGSSTLPDWPISPIEKHRIINSRHSKWSPGKSVYSNYHPNVQRAVNAQVAVLHRIMDKAHGVVSWPAKSRSV